MSEQHHKMPQSLVHGGHSPKSRRDRRAEKAVRRRKLRAVKKLYRVMRYGPVVIERDEVKNDASFAFRNGMIGEETARNLGVQVTSDLRDRVKRPKPD